MDSDNARDFMEEMPMPTQKQEQESRSDIESEEAAGPSESQIQLLISFYEQQVNTLRVENEGNEKIIEALREQHLQLLNEKCSILSKLATPSIENMMLVLPMMKELSLKEEKIIAQMREVMGTDSQTNAAYDAHCEQAKKALRASVEQHSEYDEYTNMSFLELTEAINQNETATENIRAEIDKFNEYFKLKEANYEAMHQSLLAETTLLEQYEQECLELLEKRRIESRLSVDTNSS